MSMISYAQNGEDVVLRRALTHDDGFYIEVGTSDPESGSPTRYFYEQGWTGINIEPGGIFEKICQHRPRDVNLNVGISSQPGSITYWECPNIPGWSTCDQYQADEHQRRHDVEFVERQIEVKTLQQICEAHVRRPIDFLVVDVEGYERQVLQGADWTRWRPVVVVVEATRPASTVPTHTQWEEILFGANYQFALFDGLNRFYLRNESEDLLPLLQAPASALDQYLRYDEYRLQQELQRLQMMIAQEELSPTARRIALRLQRWSHRFPRLSAVAGRVLRRAA